MGELLLKNYLEDLVIERVGKYLAQSDMCTCEGCVLDVCAIVLNGFPPKYVVTSKGALFAKAGLMQQQFEIDLMTKIVEASQMVASSPRHREN